METKRFICTVALNATRLYRRVTRYKSQVASYNLAQAFVLEAARIDSPVTGVTALAPKGGHTLKRRGGSSLSV